MIPRAANIRSDSPGQQSLELDGRPVRGVRSLTLTMSAGQIPTLAVDLLVDKVNARGTVQARVSDDVRNLLVELGWTPPEPTPKARKKTADDQT